MRWTICVISALPVRQTELTRTRGILERQIKPYKDVELIINTDEQKVGEKRQKCLEMAQGAYISFVDDDDLVAHDYVDTIYPLLDGKDYIGFKLQSYHNGSKQKPSIHSLRNKTWGEDDSCYYRGITHLNPIKTDLARQSKFEGGDGEDERWAEKVAAKTQHYISKPMYFYFFSTEYSLFERDRHGNA